MNDLKSVNVEKCLAVLNEFYDAVPVEGSGSDLLFKKQEAGKALGHLETLYRAKPDDLGDGEEECTGCTQASQIEIPPPPSIDCQ